MMPVENLPPALWQTALGLGFLSAVFDNIPLTTLALEQGGYDWGLLAYAVGFGGSMIWFGSSAGVALSNQHPEAKSVGAWLRYGWYVVVESENFERRSSGQCIECIASFPRRERPLLAQSGHSVRADECPLSGVKRTSIARGKGASQPAATLSLACSNEGLPQPLGR
jgi:hypothetical protein